MAQQDQEQRRRARLLKEYRAYRRNGGRDLYPWEIDKLKAEGLVDDDGLTPAGTLALHQLQLLKWMSQRYHYENQRLVKNK
jgi:hypothetical protein